MLLVYTHKITPRVTYVFKHICARTLGLPVSFTAKVEELIAHEGPKLSYTTKKLGNELHIKSSDILFEQGVVTLDISVQDWDGVACFFQNKDLETDLAFDIFAASFYLLSRYEEYLPHVKDKEGRFPAGESLAYQHNFLKEPVIDIWTARFGAILEDRFSDLEIKKQTFDKQMIVIVPQSFKFRKIGFLRQLGGYFKDFSKLRLRESFRRTQVLLGFRKDPYDTFSWIINIQKQVGVNFRIFFQVGDYAYNSKNIKYSKRSFQTLIKMVADYCHVGLLVSQHATSDDTGFNIEKQRMEQIIHRPLGAVHFSKFKLTLPHSYRRAIEQEAIHDYTMGYPNDAGFRAGTSRPFLFYDLDYEIQTPLLINPVCFVGENMISNDSHSINYVEIKELLSSVKTVGGTCIFAFGNASFYNVFSKKLVRTLLIDNE